MDREGFVNVVESLSSAGVLFRAEATLFQRPLTIPIPRCLDQQNKIEEVIQEVPFSD